ncbi:N-acetylneuraminate lyase [Streptococcus pneumoniae]|nr:N-acetylneuraminate lyase [Streptococcus pneumoniae]
MSDLKKYEGVIPAFYACYDDQGEVSPERTRALVQYFIDKGVQGLYVNGSSGECIYQSVEDRKLILEEVMAVAKGKLTIIAHVACNNTKDSMELARHAESLGVDAIATIPPIYFRLPEYSVAKYWNDISSAAPNTDYVIYNIPQLAGVALTPSLYTEMLKNPRVIGVKNSSMPVQDIQTFVSLGGEDHIVFNGPDEQFLGGRLMGARAGIGGTVKKSRRVPVFKIYLRSFKQNLKLGLQLGLMELGIVFLTLSDLYLFWGQTALPFQLLKAICLGILIFLTIVMLASYPIAARYDLSWKEILQKGLMLASFNFPWFFLMLAILVLIVMVLYLSAFSLLLGGSVFLLFGFGLLVFIQTGLMEKIFAKYQ